MTFSSALLAGEAETFGQSAERENSGDYIYQAWQADDGLPGNAVSAVVQDQDGFLWLGTMGGLVRFDGVRFKIFSSPLVARVDARNIRALARGMDGSLLILPATGGIAALRKGVFEMHPASTGLTNKSLHVLFAERDGAIWIGTEDGELTRWEKGQSRVFSAADGLNSRARLSVAEDAAGRIWIGSGGFLAWFQAGQLTKLYEQKQTSEATVVAASRSGGVWVWRDERLLKITDGQECVVNTNLPWVRLGGAARNMFEDSRGGLWVGTSGHGLYRFAKGVFSKVETSQSQITCISEDREGSVWVTMSGGGINRLRPKLFQLWNTGAGLPEDLSEAVAPDPRGGVWLANRGGGAVKIEAGKVLIAGLRNAAGRRLRANTVCLDDNGNLWVSEGGVYHFPVEMPDRVEISAESGLRAHVMFKSRNGDVWVGGEDGALGRYRQGRLEDLAKETNFPDRKIRALAEDAAGRLWIGTETGNLYRREDGAFKKFSAADGLPRAPVRALFDDAQGNLWIGSIGGGLVLHQNGRFTAIDGKAGLPDDHIAAVIEDGKGRLWCGSRSGVFYLAKQEALDFGSGKRLKVTATSFGASEGLSGISCLGSCQPMACAAADGALWFATQQGALAIHTATLQRNQLPPPVFIDEVLVNDQPLPITRRLQVPPLCKKIEFRFSALSYIAPDKVRLRYRLEGVDSDWVEVVNRRDAIYTALPSGQYQLVVTACNNNGVWNETGDALQFAVLPAWWQSWWFRGAALSVLIIGAAASIRYWAQRRLKLKLERLERQEAVERERTRIARDLHDDLGATVSEVGLLLEEFRHNSRPQDELRLQSEAISGRVRALARDLDAVVWTVNPQNDSLGGLVSYLSQFFLEFFRRSTVRPRLDVAEGIPDLPLKPEVRHHIYMIVKEAANNVVKHAHANEVTLRLGMQDSAFEMRIEDNGRGFSPGHTADAQRCGLKNIQARIHEVGGTLELASQPGTGTVIRIRIPSWNKSSARIPEL